MFMGLLHNLIKRIIFAYQFKNRHYEKFSNLQRLPNTKGSS